MKEPEASKSRPWQQPPPPYPPPKRIRGSAGLKQGDIAMMTPATAKQPGTARAEKMDILVDSGASVSAIPRDAASNYPIVATKSLPQYRAANGTLVYNEGDRVVTSRLSDGTRQNMRFTVMDVQRPIASVSRIVHAGHKVVFDAGGSYIENTTTGTQLRVFERDGVYVLPARVEEPQTLLPWE